MPDLDLQPHEYRRKGDWIVRHLNVDTFKWWVTVAGIAAASVIVAFGYLLPTAPWWLAWGVALAPGLTIIVAYELLEGTHIKREAGTKDRAPAGTRSLRGLDRASRTVGRAADASHARLPKARSDRSSYR